MLLVVNAKKLQPTQQKTVEKCKMTDFISFSLLKFIQIAYLNIPLQSSSAKFFETNRLIASQTVSILQLDCSERAEIVRFYLDLLRRRTTLASMIILCYFFTSYFCFTSVFKGGQAYLYLVLSFSPYKHLASCSKVRQNSYLVYLSITINTLQASQIRLLLLINSFYLSSKKSECFSIIFFTLLLIFIFLGSLGFHHNGAKVLFKTAKFINRQDDVCPIQRYASIQFSFYRPESKVSPLSKLKYWASKQQQRSFIVMHSFCKCYLIKNLPQAIASLTAGVNLESKVRLTMSQQLFFSLSHSFIAVWRTELIFEFDEVNLPTFSSVMVSLIWLMKVALILGTFSIRYSSSSRCSYRVNSIKRSTLREMQEEAHFRINSFSYCCWLFINMHFFTVIFKGLPFFSYLFFSSSNNSFHSTKGSIFPNCCIIPCYLQFQHSNASSKITKMMFLRKLGVVLRRKSFKLKRMVVHSANSSYTPLLLLTITSLRTFSIDDINLASPRLQPMILRALRMASLSRGGYSKNN